MFAASVINEINREIFSNRFKCNRIVKSVILDIQRYRKWRIQNKPSMPTVVID